ncbi:sensor domain-containing protein [Mycobacterium mantenii]|uniref:sensor domain-containing protein n=1 Tax=Mycobacterium mantenii TaxID=560555 RepID=UPI001A972BBA|nr:sensor domain-containing protein [Mycobacterium mantenii]
MPSRDEANVLATLSVVFAFVFAPAGLILGHLGLAQIRRTGQRGRDRALVGVTLSYVFVTAAVVALIVGATVKTDPSPAAAPTTTTTAARTATTTTTTPPPPPPPTVAPADVDGLLPSLEDAESITGDHAMTAQRALHQPTPDPERGSSDRPDCWPVMEAGAPEGYDLPAILGFSASEFADNHDPYDQWVTAQAVAAFRDPTVARAQLTRLQSVMRQCGGSTLHATWPNGKTYPVSMKPPVDAGNGISTMDLVPQTPIHIFCVHTFAGKANVTVDLEACSTKNADRSQQVALSVANLILGRIPG